MKIADSSVALTSSHFFQEEKVKEESLKTWVGQERPVFDAEAKPAVALPASGGDQVLISKEALIRQFQAESKPGKVEERTEEGLAEDPRLRAMRLILEALTGEKTRSVRMEDFEGGNAAPPPGPAGPGQAGAPPKAGWGLEYNLYEYHAEQEEMTFGAAGKVVTQDGQEIDFQLQLTMARKMVETTQISIRAGDAVLVDPLVINFDAPAAALTDLKFSFDLNLDGKKEDLSFVGAGSGFLALDRNNDGVINSGAELFGPQTGSGFAELAQYDRDGNGWIDENDPIYEKLRIWSKDASGNDYLVPLAQRNVGALLLAAADTPFSFKGGGGALLGELSHSSVFLRENGGAGTVQEVDLAI